MGSVQFILRIVMRMKEIYCRIPGWTTSVALGHKLKPDRSVRCMRLLLLEFVKIGEFMIDKQCRMLDDINNNKRQITNQKKDLRKKKNIQTNHQNKTKQNKMNNIRQY